MNWCECFDEVCRRFLNNPCSEKFIVTTPGGSKTEGMETTKRKHDFIKYAGMMCAMMDKDRKEAIENKFFLRLEEKYKKRDAVILWLARELAKWELATDGHWMTPEIIEEHALRCIEAARKATEGKEDDAEACQNGDRGGNGWLA